MIEAGTRQHDPGQLALRAVPAQDPCVELAATDRADQLIGIA
jgi:hypothetical protein